MVPMSCIAMHRSLIESLQLWRTPCVFAVRHLEHLSCWSPRCKPVWLSLPSDPQIFHRNLSSANGRCAWQRRDHAKPGRARHEAFQSCRGRGNVARRFSYAYVSSELSWMTPNFASASRRFVDFLTLCVNVASFAAWKHHCNVHCAERYRRQQRQNMIKLQLRSTERRLKPASRAWSLRPRDSQAKTTRRSVLQKAPLFSSFFSCSVDLLCAKNNLQCSYVFLFLAC